MRGRSRYAAAGVDIDAAESAKKRIKELARTTFRPEVLGDVGFFGGFYRLAGYRDPVLVSSADGVGTKLKIAFLLDRHDTVGLDLVHHCVNDILTSGAEPLFFLDYLATGKLDPARVESIVSGLAAACRDTGCVLIGGETAQMPGFYHRGEYDLAGFIVGAMERDRLLDGRSIAEGDLLLGLPSSGLHTNGYSLVRRVFKITSRQPLEVFYPELGRTLGEELLEPHRCYLRELKPALSLLKGIAHITGGGLIDNVPRILPQGLAARFNLGSWPILPIFTLIQERGKVSREEMFRVFNMGLGMVLVVDPEVHKKVLSLLPGARVVGEVVEQKTKARVKLC